MATPDITEAEWEVMEALWQGHPATAGDLVGRLASRRTWAEGTVKALLNRLVRKRAIGFTRAGKAYRYRPLVTREAVVRAESASFLDRLFAGRASDLVAHFLDAGQLSPEDLEHLRKVIAREGEQQ